MLTTANAAPARRLLEFDRSVMLLWSPDGRSLAVTDHAASEQSVLWVFSGAGLATVTDVEVPFRQAVGVRPEVFGQGHRYFEAAVWLSSTLLRFNVRAYDRAPREEFVGRFRYRLSGRVSREATVLK